MTSISDRCKTAREGATPGPWRSYFDVGYYSVAAADGWPVATDVKDEDAALIALAPEAADEVVRLTNAIEELAYRLVAQARAVDTDKDGKLFALAFETYTELFELLERRHQ